MVSPLLLLSILVPLCLAIAPAQTYVNTAVARTIELGGAIARSTTQYNVKALVDSPGSYKLALGGEGDVIPAWWEVSVGGKQVEATISSSGPPTVDVDLGKLKKDDTAVISLTTLSGHTMEPLPKEIAQTDKQYLLWTSKSTYVDSWYKSEVERVKIRTPTASIISYDSVPDTYTRDNTITKAASTLTLGPFSSLPPTLGGDIARKPFKVHFETRDAVIGLRKYKRSAEVSHWGANLNIQDELELVNNGPKLKGFFSRLAHMQSRFHGSQPAQIFKELALRLPPTAHTPYYYDTIGNVSTSHFRGGSTPAMKQKSSKVRTSPRTVDSVLELKPRYPILGGWNYTFTIGYDMPLGDVLKVDGERNVLGVPFITAWNDLLVDDVEMDIILPEGAKNVEVFTPFATNVTHWTHKTFLDSTGRHAITLRKTDCTENHAQTVYVTYTYSLSAQLQKPLTIASVVAGLFLLSMGLRRVDYRIEK